MQSSLLFTTQGKHITMHDVVHSIRDDGDEGDDVVIIKTTMTMMSMDNRWGRVRSVVTLRDVAVGEELLVDYGYDLIR